ncbi:MAG: hypothetical protein QM778_02295 [Myxococcales bacterium]
MAVAALGAGACGGDDDGGSSSVSSGTKISDLSDAQEMTLCKEIADRIKPLNDGLSDFSCIIEGLTAESQGLGMCEDVANTCKSQPVEEADAGTATGDIDCTMSDGSTADCNATVGEFRACIDAQVKQAQTLFGSITCDSDPNELNNTQTPPTPAECKVLESKCPAFMNEVDTDMGGV